MRDRKSVGYQAESVIFLTHGSAPLGSRKFEQLAIKRESTMLVWCVVASIGSVGVNIWFVILRQTVESTGLAVIGFFVIQKHGVPDVTQSWLTFVGTRCRQISTIVPWWKSKKYRWHASICFFEKVVIGRPTRRPDRWMVDG
jgi:hypothetical protein